MQSGSHQVWDMMRWFSHYSCRQKNNRAHRRKVVVSKRLDGIHVVQTFLFQASADSDIVGWFPPAHPDVRPNVALRPRPCRPDYVAMCSAARRTRPP